MFLSLNFSFASSEYIYLLFITKEGEEYLCA